MYKYQAYYYNPNRDMAPGIDANKLSVEGKFIGYITSCKCGYKIEELVPSEGDGDIVLLVPFNTNLNVCNFNPCPEEP